MVAFALDTHQPQYTKWHQPRTADFLKVSSETRVWLLPSTDDFAQRNWRLLADL
jgi:hypothetical protein